MRAPGSNAAPLLFVSVGLVGCSRFPRLRLGLELYSERMVTERSLTHGMLGLTWYLHLPLSGE